VPKSKNESRAQYSPDHTWGPRNKYQRQDTKASPRMASGRISQGTKETTTDMEKLQMT